MRTIADCGSGDRAVFVLMAANPLDNSVAESLPQFLST
jgi:hypothetical protein